MKFSLTALRLASGITIEVEFSSKSEVEFKLVVFMMKVSRCLKKIGNETIASTHDHEAIGRGHGGRAAREEKIFFFYKNELFWSLT